MAKSFFGGDTRKAHFGVSAPYFGKLPMSERIDKKRAIQKVLKEAGYPETRYFQFLVKDEKAKAAMKQQAEEYAAKLRAELGIELEVFEGCFL